MLHDVIFNFHFEHFIRFSKTMADTVAPFMKATFRPQHLFEEKDYAVVLLNQNIKLNTEVFIKIWNNGFYFHIYLIFQ